MNIKTIDEMLELKYYQKRLMAVDLGEKTIGVSMSDQTWTIANPVTVIQRTSYRADIQTIVKYIEDYRVAGIIVGLPRNMNGTYGPQAEKMRAFASEIMENCAIPVALWDERMSTMAVNRTMLTADMSRARRAKVVDKLAATYILQGALDYLNLLERRREAVQ